MSLQFDDFSRFRHSEPIIRDGSVTFGRWKRPDFMRVLQVPEDEIVLYSVNQTFAGRPDKIAEDFYQSSYLEWIVILFNRPLNPLGWPQAGKVIRLPSPKIVFSNL